MELRISKRVFFDAVIEGGMLSKQMKNSTAHAVQLGESLAEIECDGRRSNECLEKLRAALTDFFMKVQRQWAKCGRRKGRVLAKYGKHFEGDIVVVADDDGTGDGTGDEDGGTLSQSAAGGRPAMPYNELSARSKRRASRELSRDHLTPGGSRVEIQHQLHLTMIDGKVIGALMETGSATCNMCGTKPSEMNDLSTVADRPVRSESLQFGLSTLHAWIRVFECVLHISYKLPIAKWRAVTEQDKAAVSDRQRAVKQRFRDQMQLVVDQSYSGGSGGSTNDGNTTRRAFNDVHVLSDVTGVDVELLQRFSVILSALSSSSTIDEGKYHRYAMDTAELYVALYSWYNMPASLHKILVHGADIINGLEPPIGAYSEEAQ